MARTKQRARRSRLLSNAAASAEEEIVPQDGRNSRRRVAQPTDWRPKWTPAGRSGRESGENWMLVYSAPFRDSPVRVNAGEVQVSDGNVEILCWDPRARVTQKQICFQDTTNWPEYTSFADDPRLLSVRILPSFSAEVILPEVVPACLVYCARQGCAAVSVSRETGLVRFFLRARGATDAGFEPDVYSSSYAMGVLLRWACAIASSFGEGDDEIDDDLGDHAEIVARPAMVCSYQVNIDPAWVYAAVKREKDDCDRTHYQQWMTAANRDILNVQLRPYQRRAVAWMLSRELGPVPSISRWTHVRDVGSGGSGGFEINTVRQIVRQVGRPHEDGEFHARAMTTPRGGLLCDAMGLGKTVEFLQLIALNRLSPDREGVPQCNEVLTAYCVDCIECDDDVRLEETLICMECNALAHVSCSGTTVPHARKVGFVCQRCCNELRRVEFAPLSRATLIIVPPTLLSQWKSEIENHVANALKVLVFEGLHETGYVRQQALLNADVVLTTYTALKHDVNVARSLLNSSMSLRSPKKYRPTPTPLLFVRWWRIALDEAQMLGKSASVAVEMASRLSANYRWCVTGTPVTKSITDLDSILQVLNVGHGFSPEIWKRQFVAPAWDGFDTDRESLRFALRQIMWRTEKEGMAEDELVLPRQEVQFVRVSLGPVEKYHYSRLHDRMRDLSLARLERYGNDIKPARQMIHCLRQACCHPQVGASGQQLITRHTRLLGQERAASSMQVPKRRRLDAAAEARWRSRNPLTMGEVLDELVTKARSEFVDVFRMVVAESNGYAGVLLLRQQLPYSYDDLPIAKAIDIYRETLRLAHKCQDMVKMDMIQRMHIMHNLGKALEEVEARIRHLALEPINVERIRALRTIGISVREASLKEEVQDMKKQYISSARQQLVACTEKLSKCTEKVGSKVNGPHTIDAPSDLEVETMDLEVEEQDMEDVEDTASSPTSPRRMWWWERAIGIIHESGQSTMFLENLTELLLQKTPKKATFSFKQTLANTLTTIPAMYSGLQKALKSLATARQSLVERVHQLPGSVEPTENDILVSGQCGTCRDREIGIGPECQHCKAEKLLNALEQQLYFIESEKTDGERTSGRATAIRTRNANVVSRAMHIALRSNAPSAPDRKLTSGVRLRSEIEEILVCLFASSRAKMDAKTVREAEKYISHFQTLKAEFDACKGLFEAQRNYLSKLDEIGMALMRFSLTQGDASLSQAQQRIQIRPEMIPSLEAQFSSDKARCESELQEKRGSLVYLMSLKRDLSSATAGYTLPEGTTRCPICLDEYTQEVAILGCAHPFCYDCALALIKKVPVMSVAQRLKCPTCRKQSHVDEVKFTVMIEKPEPRPPAPSTASIAGPSIAGPSSKPVLRRDVESVTPSPDSIIPRNASRGTRTSGTVHRAPENPSTFCDPSVSVEGAMGAKLSAIVRVLKTISSRDPSAKALVFSQWTEVLDLISGTLRLNDIPHLGGGEHSAKKIGGWVDKFKHSRENVLLLPLIRAGSGLNLTEATHVLLVEPSLNPALETQAVGRVHRIGQTKPTTVHRFVVSDTIEDRVLAIAAGRNRADQSVEEQVSVEDVRALFERTERVAGS